MPNQVTLDLHWPQVKKLAFGTWEERTAILQQIQEATKRIDILQQQMNRLQRGQLAVASLPFLSIPSKSGLESSPDHDRTTRQHRPAASQRNIAPPLPERKAHRGGGSRFTSCFTPSPSDAVVILSHRLQDPNIMNPVLLSLHQGGHTNLDRHAGAAGDTRKQKVILPYPKYQSYEALLVDWWVRVRSFLEAQSEGIFLVNPARFDFSGEFSVVALDLDVIRHRKEVAASIVSRKEAFERVSGLKFGPTSWASILGDIGAVAIRFASVHVHPAPKKCKANWRS
ncbi:hypothetical protein B0H14DRAFT_3742036 [Mycena olivaceomarginata]|nr:hypothetical protein B0H14DRAFT_3742036 [Mycena olivaceomarginata]